MTTEKTAKSQVSPNAKLTWLPQKTFELEFVIPWSEVKKSYAKNLQAVAEKTTIKGFRQGKAPLDTVEKNLDKGKLYGLVVEDLLPQTYFAAIKQHNLQPICEPKITPLKTEEENDWSFKASACEMPEIKLGDYENQIKAVSAKDKIWVPGQDKNADKKQEKSEEEKMKAVFAILLKECRVELSAMLVDEEEKRMLSRLLQEIQKLGLTLDEYLQSNAKTIQQLKEEYHQTSEETLKLEFILQAIAREKNFMIEAKEIEALINAVPDALSRKNLQTPMQKAYIASLLKKRKAIDFLLKI